MTTRTTEHIPNTDPRCQAIQGGYDSYGQGLLLSPTQHITYAGEWLLSYPEGGGEDFTKQWANVHFIPDRNAYPMRHDGRWVYGVRFWVDSCSKCDGPCQEWNRALMCPRCGDAQAEIP